MALSIPVDSELEKHGRNQDDGLGDTTFTKEHLGKIEREFKKENIIEFIKCFVHNMFYLFFILSVIVFMVIVFNRVRINFGETTVLMIISVMIFFSLVYFKTKLEMIIYI